jgi:hypothetical protein
MNHKEAREEFHRLNKPRIEAVKEILKENTHSMIGFCGEGMYADDEEREELATQIDALYQKRIEQVVEWVNANLVPSDWLKRWNDKLNDWGLEYLAKIKDE